VLQTKVVHANHIYILYWETGVTQSV